MLCSFQETEFPESSQLTHIGSGSFVEAFRVEIKGQFFCLKLWKDSSGNGIPLDAIREISSLRCLKHPLIISLHSFGSRKRDKRFFGIYELMTSDLKSFIKQPGYVPQASIIKHIIHQIITALDYIHSEGFVHRDINPSNILISPERDHMIKLADFGLCVRANDCAPNPKNGKAGTILYLAPEQISGDLLYTFESDIWSAGCVVAELCLGRPLFVNKKIDDLKVEQLNFLARLFPEEFDQAIEPDKNFLAFQTSVLSTIGPSGMDLLKEMLHPVSINRRDAGSLSSLDFFSS